MNEKCLELVVNRVGCWVVGVWYECVDIGEYVVKGSVEDKVVDGFVEGFGEVKGYNDEEWVDEW